MFHYVRCSKTLVLESHAVNATLYSKLPYDTLRDFAGVAPVASIPNILIINNIVPAKNVKELIALAKAQPGKFNYGSAGIGAASHLNGELFRSMAGIEIAHIPFKGFGEQLLNQGAEPAASTPAQFDVYLKAEVAKLGKLVKESGARVD